jgi:hypothetical protein
MGFNKRKMQAQRAAAAEKEAAAKRATKAQVLEDAGRLVAAWNARQGKRMLMLFSPTAREFHDVVNELFAVSERRPRVHLDHRPLSSPLSLLYFHVLELGLKAFLRACGKPIEGTSRRHHRLTKLYEECRKSGLVVNPDDKVGLGNIVNLLESSNEGYGYRYSRSGSVVTADLAWTHEIVQRSIAVIARKVERRDPNAHDPPRVAKIIMTVEVT